MKLAIILVCGALLTGCATTVSPNVQAANVATASWTSLDAAVKLVDQAALSGTLHGANAVRVSDDIRHATAALAAADDARVKGDAASVTSDIATASTVLVEILLIANTPNVTLPAR